MGNVLLVSCANRVLVIIFAGGWGGGGGMSEYVPKTVVLEPSVDGSTSRLID